MKFGNNKAKRFALGILAGMLGHTALAADGVESLSGIDVVGEKIQPITAPTSAITGDADRARLRTSTSDTAKMLEGLPGVSVYGAGGVSSLPAIHGLADDRLRIKLDGMDLVASCPNHMNSPLSYVDPSNVGSIKAYAGITPVSVGGDSIGGSIVVETPAPVFAAAGQGRLSQGEVGAFYRSNGSAKGGHVSATVASKSVSLSYSGAMAESGNYKADGNFKTMTDTGVTGHTLPLDEVGSTAYKTRNHTLGLAVKSGEHLVEAGLGFQDIPYEYYPNQRMDMLDNTQHRFNLHYLGQLDWGTLEARAYDEKVDHYMDFGPDKKFLYTAGNTTQGMPMRTEGKTTGVSVKASIETGAQQILRVGAEIQNYRLNDWWPGVIGSMGMGPNDFINIHDGKRDRTALFGELEQTLDPQWMTLLGLRYERVSMDAGLVHGYNNSDYPVSVGMMDMMNQQRDAVAFNNADRKKTDNNWDMTAMARYTADAGSDIEFGFAHKVRSPNLYERYSWSTASMMTIMNNFVGDGNGYIGDINLKPEKANTFSASFDWHADDHSWEFKATPYYTRVTDYIDAIQWDGAANAPAAAPATGAFAVLKYVNQSARLYGFDLSGKMPLAQAGWGDIGFKGLLNYANGKNLDSGEDLYNIMPLNVRLTITQQFGGWDNNVELVAVSAKDKLSDMRNEIGTPGYSLVNLHASYTWKQARVDFGIENLFDRNYALPLGGAYVGQGSTMMLNAPNMPWGIPVPGMGRSLNAGLTLKF